MHCYSISYWTIGYTYSKLRRKSACCVSDGALGYHKGCYCPIVTDQSSCNRLCTNDTSCKGYTMLKTEGGALKCELATTKECSLVSNVSNTCYEKDGADQKRVLDSLAECGAQKYSGCFIKKSKYVFQKIYMLHSPIIKYNKFN